MERNLAAIVWKRRFTPRECDFADMVVHNCRIAVEGNGTNALQLGALLFALLSSQVSALWCHPTSAALCNGVSAGLVQLPIEQPAKLRHQDPNVKDQSSLNRLMCLMRWKLEDPLVVVNDIRTCEHILQFWRLHPSSDHPRHKFHLFEDLWTSLACCDVLAKSVVDLFIWGEDRELLRRLPRLHWPDILSLGC